MGATGTLLTRGVDSVAEGDDHGTWVAPHIGAPIHQHFFNFRIDFDVDGTANRLVEQDIRPESSPAGNAFAIERTMVETEQARDADPTRQRRWMIEGLDAGPDGRVGAYMLMPGDTMPAYSSPDFPPLHHAPFAQHALWVSRYRDGELYASGDYPNQGEPGQGLPEYTAAGESVDGEDLVVWHTVGMVHQPMPEHYPVMTTHRVGFSLQPSGFFSRNPALDAPKHTSDLGRSVRPRPARRAIAVLWANPRELAVVVARQSPAVLVHEPVMEGADEREVLEVGLTAPRPPLDVVRLREAPGVASRGTGRCRRGGGAGASSTEPVRA